MVGHTAIGAIWQSRENDVETIIEEKHDKLVQFLYVLLRDELPFGTVEKILKYNIVQSNKVVVFDDSNLYNYAKSLAERLK